MPIPHITYPCTPWAVESDDSRCGERACEIAREDARYKKHQIVAHYRRQGYQYSHDGKTARKGSGDHSCIAAPRHRTYADAPSEQQHHDSHTKTRASNASTEQITPMSISNIDAPAR